MTANIKKLTIVLIFICAVSGFFACTGWLPQDISNLSREAQSFSLNTIKSFRDIPGITEEEIEAIEILKKSRSQLVYGSMPTTEAFMLPDGTKAGFKTFFSDLLSELFGIPFVQEILPWDALKEGLDAKIIDFSGELTPTPERKMEYFMTYPIAERSLCVYTLDHITKVELDDLNGRRIGFYTGTITAESVLAAYPILNFEVVDVYDDNDLNDKITTGKIDMFINEDVAEAIYGTLITHKNIFPLIYTPVSMSTANSGLAPVISVVDKYIISGGIDKIYDLYIKGYLEYTKFNFYKSLTDTEKEYLDNLLKNNSKIPISLENHNYPVSFYNINDNSFQGIAPDVLSEITKLTGIEFENISRPEDSWNTILQRLISGEAAMVSDLFKTESRIGSFLWPEKPLATTKYALISKIDYPFLEPYQVIRDVVGVIKNSALEEVFLSMFPHHDKIIRFDNNDGCFDALERGEVDLVMATESQFLTLFHYLEKPGYKINISFNSPVVESFFGFNINEDILISIINKALISINTDRIEKNWINRSFNYERIMADQRAYYSNQTLTLMTIFSVILMSLLIVLVVLLSKNKKTQKLYKNEALMLNAIFNSNPDLILCKDASGKFTKVNNSYKKFLELDDDKIIGKTAKDVYTYNDNFLNLANESDEKVLASDTLLKFEDFAYNRNGCQVFFDVIKTPLISDGKAIGLLGIMRDITEKKQMMDTLRERERMLETLLNQLFELTEQKNNTLVSLEKILNSIDAGIYVSVPETGELLFVNTYLKKAFNLDDTVIGKYCYKIFRTGLNEICNFCPCLQLDKDPDKTIIWEEYEPKTGNTLLRSDCYINWYDGRRVHLQHVIDITELITAKDLAEQSNRAKSFFLAQMSHEIRTPINAILGISEIFLQNKNISTEITVGGASCNEVSRASCNEVSRASCNEVSRASCNEVSRASCNEVSRAEEGFRKIYESGSLLTNIINDILDFSKIEAGKLEIIPKKYDVPIFINDTVQLNRIRYENKPIDFILQLDKNIPAEAIGDELRIRQILNNLISNAFKYTERGKVRFSFSIESPSEASRASSSESPSEASRESPSEASRESPSEDLIFIFKVSDTGQGMNEDQLNRLFNEYERFNMDINQGITGTGLGMNITKRLIGLMDGEIIAESDVGIGSLFTVRIPQKKCDSIICSKEIIESLQNFNFRAASLQKNEQIIHEYMPDNKVLIVDDIESNLFVAKGLMLPYGLKIETAGNGLEAVEKIKNGNFYDIIFMDYMMPKMNGIDAVKIIRDMGYIHPIVALTANAIHGQKEVFLSNGFNDFISKPIDSRELDLLLLHFIRDKNVFSAKQKYDAKEELQHNSARDKITEVEKYFALDAKNTINVLNELTPKLQGVNPRVNPNLNDEELELYVITVHGIKSALANISENKLSDDALKLEQAGNNRNFAVIVNETPAFIDALQSLLNIINLEKN